MRERENERVGRHVVAMTSQHGRQGIGEGAYHAGAPRLSFKHRLPELREMEREEIRSHFGSSQAHSHIQPLSHGIRPSGCRPSTKSKGSAPSSLGFGSSTDAKSA